MCADTESSGYAKVKRGRMAKARTKRARRGPPRETEGKALIRRARLRQLMNERGANNLARELGYSNASFLSQMAWPNPIRYVTEKTARAYEARLSLPKGHFDQPLGDEFVSVPAVRTTRQVQQVSSVDLTAEVIRMVGRLFSEEGVDFSAIRFADIVAMAILDAAEHDGQGRPEHIRALVRLVRLVKPQ